MPRRWRRIRSGTNVLARRPGVRVPKVDWVYTTRRILAMEDVYAIKITDCEAITAAVGDR